VSCNSEGEVECSQLPVELEDTMELLDPNTFVETGLKISYIKDMKET